MFSTFMFSAKSEYPCYASLLIRINDAYKLLTEDEKKSYDIHNGKININNEYLFQIIDTDDGFICRRSNVDMNDICVRLGLYDD